jgi:hypothetical protein
MSKPLSAIHHVADVILGPGEDSSTGNVMGGRKLAHYVLELSLVDVSNIRTVCRTSHHTPSVQARLLLRRLPLLTGSVSANRAPYPASPDRGTSVAFGAKRKLTEAHAPNRAKNL